jgi:hypothetical protein
MPIDMEVLSMADGGAVTLGDGGVPNEIMQLSDGQWAVAEQFEDRFLHDIDLIGENDVWVAGFTWEQGNQGMLLHGRDGIFEEIPTPDCQVLLGLQMLDADHGWAVGQDHEFGTCILRFADQQWTREDSPGQSLLVALDLDATGSGWSIGADGLVLRREQGVWYEERKPAADRGGAIYLDLRRVGPDEAWAVGSDAGNSLHYIDGSWRLEDLGVPGTLTDLDATPDGRIWAVGRRAAPNETSIEQLEPLMLVHEDGSWREVALPAKPPTLGAIDMLDGQAGWALGFGAALRLGPPSSDSMGKIYLPLLPVER